MKNLEQKVNKVPSFPHILYSIHQEIRELPRTTRAASRHWLLRFFLQKHSFCERNKVTHSRRSPEICKQLQTSPLWKQQNVRKLIVEFRPQAVECWWFGLAPTQSVSIWKIWGLRLNNPLSFSRNLHLLLKKSFPILYNSVTNPQ